MPAKKKTTKKQTAKTATAKPKTGWAAKKEELSKKVVDFAKEACEGESLIRVRSVLSGAYFIVRDEVRANK